MLRIFLFSATKTLKWMALLVPLWFFQTVGHAAVPPSAPTPPPGGQVVVVGSAVLSDLVSRWAEGFGRVYPGIPVTVADTGSAAGIEALLNGSADVVLTSIPLSQRQKAQFTSHFGYAPTAVPVAMDGVAVYVSSLNPLREITLVQLDGIYSTTLRCGIRQPIGDWGELGVKGDLSDRPITSLGLTANSGAYQLFKRVALCDGDFHANFQALVGPEAVAAGLANNVAAIGFSSSALRSPDIRALAIARREGAPAITPTVQSIQTRQYPLAQVLSIILNITPDGNASPAVQAFLDYTRSAAGQAEAAKAGYVPLPVN